MRSDQPSRTMFRTAIRRATHQILDNPLILHDPIALQVLPEAADPHFVATMQNGVVPDPVLLRSLFVLRSRFAEDRLALAAARGIRQYVMVAAGLDTFPWRQPDYARSMQLFAVDRPASLVFRRQRLRERGFAQPANLDDVPVDLEQDNLAEKLVCHGFDNTVPSFFSMLGVAQYLSAQAVDSALRAVASLPKESEIVFSFALPDDSLSGEDLQAVRLSAISTGVVGEPWRTRLRPDELIVQLGHLGFGAVFHLSPSLARQRYFGGRCDALRAPVWEQLIAAVV